MLICKVIIVVPRCKDCGEVEEEDAVQENAAMLIAAR